MRDPVWDKTLDTNVIQAIALYIGCGWSPGGFAEHLLFDEFEEAVQRSHFKLRYDDNLVARNVMDVVRAQVPSAAWGSREKFLTWTKHKGLLGAAKDVRMLVKLECSKPYWFLDRYYIPEYLHRQIGELL